MNSLIRIAWWAAFVVLLAWLADGLFWLATIDRFAVPWDDQAILRLRKGAVYFALGAVLIETFWARRALLAYLAIALTATVAAAGAAAVFAVAYYALACFLLGDAVLRRCGGCRYEPGLDAIRALFLGVAIVALVVGPSMWLSIHTPLVYLIALALPLWLHPAPLAALGDLAATLRPDRAPPLGARAVRAAIAGVLALNLGVVLLPEVSFDALAYHLALPAAVKNAQGWSFDVARHVWAVIPMSGHWSFTTVYMLGGEAAAKLINLLWLLMLAAMVYRLGRRHATRGAALLVTLLFVSTPLAFQETGGLFIENIQAAFLLCGVLSLLAFLEERRRVDALLTGVFFGTALATKLGSVGFLLVPLAIMTWALVTPAADRGRNAAVFVLALALCAAFPFVNAWLVSGNPVFPYANDVFQSPYYDTERAFSDPRWHQGLDWDTLHRATFQSGDYLEATPGAPGFALLVLLPLAVLHAATARRRFALVLVLVSLAFVVAVFSEMAYLRYVYPALPLFFVLIATMLGDLARRERPAWWASVGFAVLAVALNLTYLSAAGWTHRDLRIDLVFDPEAQREYLKRREPVQIAVDYLNLVYGESARVAFFTRPFIAGLEGVPFLDNWHNHLFREALHRSRGDAALMELFENSGLTHFLVGPDHHRCRALEFVERVTEEELVIGNLSIRRLTRGGE